MAAALATESGKRPGEFEASKEHSLSAMSAYRGLQLKVRDAERTRDSALRERDEIKRQIYEKNRRDSLMRSRVMSNTSEKLLGIQADNDRIRKQNDELENTLNDINIAISSIQRDVVERRQRIIDETEGNGDISTRSLDVYKVARDLESEIGREHVRIEDLEQKCQRVRVGAAEAEARAKQEIVDVSIDLERQRAYFNSTHARADALENYLNMLLQINADLIDAVQAREEAKEQIQKFVVVPRYTWPKNIVKKATRVVTEAAAEQKRSKTKEMRGPNLGVKKLLPPSEEQLASSIRYSKPRPKPQVPTKESSNVKKKQKASTPKRRATTKGYMRPKSF